MTEPKRPYPNGVPIAPDTVMPPRQPVRWGSRADDPPTEIHDDPGKTKAYLAGLAAGRTEAAAASPDPPDEDAIRADERERLSARVYENGWCPTCAHKADPDAMPPHEVAAILVDPAEVLSPEEVAEYERCQQSVIDARRRAPMVEGQMIVGAAASPDERLREALALIAQHARLDLTERGIAEAERYAVIAEDALAAADREAPDEAGRICCRGMGADGGCNICAAEATR